MKGIKLPYTLLVSMEAESQVDNSNLAMLAAVAAEAAQSNDIIEPLFADTVEPVQSTTEEEISSQEETTEEESVSEASSDTSDEASETFSEKNGLNPAPPEMRQWMSEIDNIEYHYRHDEDDRGYNFFRDAAGNTLMIQEFDVDGRRYFNINREHIVLSSNFFDVLDAHAGPDGLKITTWGQQLLKNCSTDLLAEAMTILKDQPESESESESESEPEPESEPAPHPNPSPIPSKGDAESVQNFLISFFLVLMAVRAIGLIGQLV